MTDLVERLAIGMHPIEVSLRPERTVAALKDALDRGFVHIRFTGTRGGTELGVPIDRQRTDVTRADFVNEKGELTIVGELTLDYSKVRCIADVRLPSLDGLGRLEQLTA